MSTIACNPVEGSKGGVPQKSFHNDTFSEQVSQALAIKLNLKTNQHANKNALRHLVKWKTLTGGLRQTLQAKAAIYDTLLSPA